VNRLVASAFLCLAMLTAPALAGEGRIRFVEADVDLRADGKAVVAYTVQWDVVSGELHGFYFQPSGRLRANVLSERSGAVDPSGRRYDLSIDSKATRWDIVLARGAGVSVGPVTYRFAFSTDFAAARHLERTTSPDGIPLVVFNWSPTQWDEAAAQDHYTLRILTPYTLPADLDVRDHVTEQGLVLTEPWVNERYRID